MTTTEVSLHPENETRLLLLTVTDSPEQTKDVLLAIAADRSRVDADRGLVALQSWLANEPLEVDVPFGPELASLIPAVAVRLRATSPCFFS